MAKPKKLSFVLFIYFFIELSGNRELLQKNVPNAVLDTAKRNRKLSLDFYLIINLSIFVINCF